MKYECDLDNDDSFPLDNHRLTAINIYKVMNIRLLANERKRWLWKFNAKGWIRPGTAELGEPVTLEVTDGKGKTKLLYVVMGGIAQLHGAQGKTQGLACEVEGTQTTTADVRAGKECTNQDLDVTIPLKNKDKKRS